MNLACRLLGHRTSPRRDGRWYPTWICNRCGLNLRPDGRVGRTELYALRRNRPHLTPGVEVTTPQPAESAPSGECGRCGDRSPLLGGIVSPPVFCRLPAGHAGWHRGDDDSEWTPAPSVGGALTDDERERVARIVAGVDDDEWRELPAFEQNQYRRAARRVIASDWLAARAQPSPPPHTAVTALHQPFYNDHDGHIPRDTYETCQEDGQRWPCRTAAALAQVEAQPNEGANMREEGEWARSVSGRATRLRLEGRRLAREREELIAQGVDPADLLIPAQPSEAAGTSEGADRG